MNRLSLRKNRLKFKTAGGLPIALEEFMEYTSNKYRETEGCQHVTGWTCMPKNLPDHCTRLHCNSYALLLNGQQNEGASAVDLDAMSRRFLSGHDCSKSYCFSVPSAIVHRLPWLLELRLPKTCPSLKLSQSGG